MATPAPAPAPAPTPEDEQALLAAIHAILGMGPGAPAEGAPTPEAPPTVVEESPVDEMAAEELPAGPGEEAPGAVDVTPIVEALGVTEERAMELYEASQTMPAMEGIDPAELAMELANDFSLLMKLEKIIGTKADMEADDAMVLEEDAVEEEEAE